MGTKFQLRSSEGELRLPAEEARRWITRQIAWQRTLLELSRRAEAALVEPAEGPRGAEAHAGKAHAHSRRHGPVAFLGQLLGRHSRRRVAAA